MARQSKSMGKAGIAAVAVASLVAVFVLDFCLIAYTPLKTFIPGYPDAHVRLEAERTAIKADSLETEITRLQQYTEHLASILERGYPAQVDTAADHNNEITQ